MKKERFYTLGLEEGEAAKVNDIIAIVGKEGEDYKSLLEEEKNKSAEATAKKDRMKKKPLQKNRKNKAIINRMPNVELPKDAKVIRMPLLSDTMTEGKIIQWNKKVGDKVKSDDSIAEVETDKATMDVVGYEEGTLLYIGVEAGKAAKVNDIIAIVGKEGTDVSAYVNAEKNTGGNAPATTIQTSEKRRTESNCSSLLQQR